MFYPELYKTEVEAENIQSFFASQCKKKGGMDALLNTFQETNIPEAEKQVAALASNQRTFDQDFLTIKRNLLEMQLWIKLFYDVASEKTPSYSHISTVELHRQEINDKIANLLTQLKPFESSVFEWRRNRLTGHLEKQINQAIQNAQKTYVDRLKSESDPEQIHHLEIVIAKQGEFFRHMAEFLQSHFDTFEKIVVQSARGLLLTSPEQFPFSALYTIEGQIHIIFDLKQMAAGIGMGKVVNRSVHLQTGAIYAAVQLLKQFTDGTDLELEEKKRTQHFWRLWNESNILFQLKNQIGIMPLVNRLCFEIEGRKELYLIEQFFGDGTLENYFERIRRENSPETKFTLIKQIQIAAEMLNGLDQIHKAGYIHADLKPGNILLKFRHFPIPMAVIADFNIAYHYKDEKKALQLENTPNWSSPEVAKMTLNPKLRSQRTANPKLLFKSDIWSMGCILYCLLFDSPLPWQYKKTESSHQFLSKLKANWIPSIFEKNPFYPLIKKMLDIEPENRPTSEEAVSAFTAIAKRRLD